MNHLVEMRTNIIYTKIIENSKEKLIKLNEIVFLVDKPKYKYTNGHGQEIVKQRKIKEHRFVVSENTLEYMLEFLEKIKGISESELK